MCFDFITKISNMSEVVQNLWWIIVTLSVFLCILFYLNRFIKIVNRHTQKQLDYFRNNGKYIENLFVELNSTKEVVRYFIFSSKWKKRIIRKFNLLYENTYGNILRKASKEKMKLHLSFHNSVDTILKTIKDQQDLFLNFNKYKKDRFDTEYDETLWLIELASYQYREELQDMYDYCSAIKEHVLMLIGSAGNGKTNLLCNISNLIIRLKNPCIFINARDINISCIDYFYNQLCIPRSLKNMNNILFKLEVRYLILRKKKLYVILDAINENDSTIFQKTIGQLVEMLSKINGVKTIISCRSEYFEDRYKKLFSASLSVAPFIYNIKKTYYTERALRKVHNVYANYFGFTGFISPKVKEQLGTSLILTRIFYEVYKSSSENVVTLNKFQIYQKYINDLEKSTEIDIEKYLDRITQSMIFRKQFDSTATEDLNLKSDEIEELKSLADENLLISRTLKKNENTIIEETTEQWYFVFDELRDFCIAKYIIKQCSKKSDYNDLFELMDYLYTEKLSPIEGMIRYSYIYFKSINELNNCKHILSQYNSSQIPFWSDNHSWNRREKSEFNYFIFEVILDTGQPLLDFEKKLIFYLLGRSPGDFMNFFNFLVIENQHNTVYPFSLINEFLLTQNDYDIISKVLNSFSSKQYHGYDNNYSYDSSIQESLLNLADLFSKTNIEKDYIVFLSIEILINIEEYEIQEYLKEIKNIATIFKEIEQKIHCKKLLQQAKEVYGCLIQKPHIEDLSILMQNLEGERNGD